MKLLLVMLIERISPPWWRLRWSRGDPPEERVAHHALPALLSVTKMYLEKAEKENEIDP